MIFIAIEIAIEIGIDSIFVDLLPPSPPCFIDSDPDPDLDLDYLHRYLTTQPFNISPFHFLVPITPDYEQPTRVVTLRKPY